MKDYIKQATSDTLNISERLYDINIIYLLHSAIKYLYKRWRKLLDALKKYIYYGKSLDIINIIEELGDGEIYSGIYITDMQNIRNQFR